MRRGWLSVVSLWLSTTWWLWTAISAYHLDIWLTAWCQLLGMTLIYLLDFGVISCMFIRERCCLLQSIRVTLPRAVSGSGWIRSIPTDQIFLFLRDWMEPNNTFFCLFFPHWTGFKISYNHISIKHTLMLVNSLGGHDYHARNNSLFGNWNTILSKSIL